MRSLTNYTLKILKLKNLRENLKAHYRINLDYETKLKIDKLTYAIIRLTYKAS